MYSRTVHQIDQLPMPEKDRKTTDVCCCFLGIIVPIVFLIITLSVMNKSNLSASLMPVDSNGQICSKQNPDYPYLYFIDPEDISKRVCVANCPTTSSDILKCSPQTQQLCRYKHPYETSLKSTTLGTLCLPTDEFLRGKLTNAQPVKETWDFLQNVQILNYSLIISVCLGIIWLIVVQVGAKWAVWLAVGGSLLLLFCHMLIFFIDMSYSWANHLDAKYYTIIALFLLLIFLSVVVCVYRRNLTLSAILLNQSARFLGSSTGAFLLILIFIVITIIFIGVNFVVHWILLTSSATSVDKSQVWLQWSGNKPLQIIHFILFIWGIQFLKDSFNFLITGNAVEWYFTHRTTRYSIIARRYFRRNFGSIVAGSFHNIFFGPLAFIADVIICEPGGCCGRCAECWNTVLSSCTSVLGLSRTDTYAYINLAGIPYCNAARNCECLCGESRIVVGRQSSLVLYRICSHILLVGLTTLICFFMMKHATGDIKVWLLFYTGFLSFCIVGYFVDIHTDGAEGLQVCFFTEYEVQNESYEQMSRCPASLKHPIQLFDHELEIDNRIR